jgi:hypothetical protein
MKKKIGFAGFSLLITFVTAITVMAGYNFGPDNIFHLEASAGISWKGLWVEGKMSNAKLEAIEYSKRVYARSGATGTYSSWAEPSIDPVTHRNYGSFDNDYAEVRGEWK